MWIVRIDTGRGDYVGLPWDQNRVISPRTLYRPVCDGAGVVGRPSISAFNPAWYDEYRLGIHTTADTVSVAAMHHNTTSPLTLRYVTEQTRFAGGGT